MPASSARRREVGKAMTQTAPLAGAPERIRTPAEIALGDWFRARDGAGALAEARRAAFELFDRTGLPHRRIEAYKYSDLRARLRSLPAPAAPADEAAVRHVLDAAGALEGLEPIRLVIANGRFAAGLSDDVSGIAGLAVEAVTDLHVPAGLGDLARANEDPLALLNASLFEGGVSIAVAPGATIARPIEIVFAMTGPAPATAMPRVLVAVGEGASAAIVERHGLAGLAGTVSNALTELSVGAGASVSYVKMHGEGPEASHFATLFARIADRSRLEHLTVSFGAGFSRSQVFASVEGGEAEAIFSTATIATGGRHADTTLVVNHVAPGSTSREFFRSVIGTGGRAVVQGQILVQQPAQKTDARMLSNALFLDDTGESVNKPELEIFADDVQCGHGATSGELDGEMLFYLRSRGVPRRDAERMLVEAFLLEAVDNVTREDVRAAVAARLMAALHAEETMAVAD